MSITDEVKPASEPTPRENGKRFSVKQLMLQITLAAMLFAALLHENEWLRATLFTVTVAMIFNEVLAMIYARDIRRAFAIGHSLAIAFLPLCYWGVAVSLPYLLSAKFLSLMKSLQEVDETNYWIVTAIFWTHLTCRSSGYLAVLWYRSGKTKPNFAS